MVKHANIPVFIPHEGCPHDCVFCNQRSISGTRKFDFDSVNAVIERALSTRAGLSSDTEIAFFGGSFTAIPESLMIKCLDAAYRHIKAGRASSIRFSTRPDCISHRTLDVVSSYPLSAIELGIQSMSDEVLYASGRGHTALDTERAAVLIRGYKIPVIGQLMQGLPGSDREGDLSSAEKAAGLGIAGVRIYPTIVVAGTRLHDLYESGKYLPLSLDEAVVRAAEIKRFMLSKNISVIRTGLCANEILDGEQKAGMLAGPYHPAFGELVDNQLYLEIMTERLDELGSGNLPEREVMFFVSPSCMSKAAGQNQKNKKAIAERYRINIKNIKIVPDPLAAEYEVEVRIGDKTWAGR